MGAEPEQEGSGQTYVQPRFSRTTLETETASAGGLLLGRGGEASILTGSPYGPLGPGSPCAPFSPWSERKRRITGRGGASADGQPSRNLPHRLWVRRVRPGQEDRPPPAESHRLPDQGRKSASQDKQEVERSCLPEAAAAKRAGATDGRAGQRRHHRGDGA